RIYFVLAFWQQSIFQAARCNITFVQLLPYPEIVSLAIVNGSQYYQIHCTTLAIQLFYYSGWNNKLQVAALIYDSSVAFEKIGWKKRIFRIVAASDFSKMYEATSISKSFKKNRKKFKKRLAFSRFLCYNNQALGSRAQTTE